MNKTLKNILLIFLILLVVFLVVFSFPATSINQGTLLSLFLVGFFILALAYVLPWKKLQTKPASYIENMNKSLMMLVRQGVDLPISFRDDELIQKLDYDINVNMGNYHFVRFMDPKTRTTRNLLYDIRQQVPIGELKNTKLDAADPKEAISEVARIIAIIETNRPIDKYRAPLLVKEIERTVPSTENISPEKK